jgi:hypothetical protein
VEGSKGKFKKRQAMKPSSITKYFDGKGLEKKPPIITLICQRFGPLHNKRV